MKNITAHAHDISCTFSVPHTNHFQHSFLSNTGCSGGKPGSPSILPVAQCSKNNSGFYRGYSHHKVWGDLAPEQFLGTMKRDDDDDGDGDDNNSKTNNNN